VDRPVDRPVPGGCSDPVAAEGVHSASERGRPGGRDHAAARDAGEGTVTAFDNRKVTLSLPEGAKMLALDLAPLELVT
jgi:hypothetical protein